MESRGPEDSKNVKTSQAYFFEGFISFFEDFSLTNKASRHIIPWKCALFTFSMNASFVGGSRQV